MFATPSLNSDLTIGIVSGFISSAVFAFFCWLCHYFRREERFARKRMTACRKALYELMERFNIEIGHSGLFELTPTLSPENYILCLFETYLIINKTTGRQRYPDDDIFKTTAKEWYAEWNNARMADVIEYISPSGMNYLLIEVNSWGINGRPWLERYLPLVAKMYHMIKNWQYNHRNKSVKLCDFLFRDYKLPSNNNYSNQVMLELLSGDDKEVL